ncbi:hypothetical protein B2G71_12845 [Novosphingobium sp. PC22D]|uniref:hypothetical protein n=1 Tax=Novosphingobium sp. PC22D TaxID=1962403 RepID=UPI000BEFACF6|nr:hypothetical protein [Novosphingobium sp. PC22D]PEQ12374.1 hypothetical protein B2G71_12845 [Novosphingobium sp. PC22D]
MRRLALPLCLLAVACAGGPGGGPASARGQMRDLAFGSPGTIVAVELAFNRAASEDGQWSAFRDFADDDAVMFVPQPVDARDWLKGRDDPPAPVTWQPHEVWVSCDGSLAATRGAWQRPNGSVGYFTTIWHRRKQGDYRWVLDQGDELAAPLEAPEMLAGQIADCGLGRDSRRAADWRDEREREATIPPVGTAGTGRSADGTLEYSYRVTPDLGRTISVSIRKDGEMREVISSVVAPPKGD